MLGIKEYPHPTVPGLFNELLRAPYEFVLTQSFVCMDKASARTALKRQRDRLESTEDDALEQIDDLNEALNDLQSNKFTMGEHHMSLLIKADDVKALANNVAEARAALGDSGCVVAREDLALEAAFWSQLPGNFKYRARPAPITSYNFVGMSAFHNYPTAGAQAITGAMRSHCSRPARARRTTSTTTVATWASRCSRASRAPARPRRRISWARKRRSSRPQAFTSTWIAAAKSSCSPTAACIAARYI
jgi:hypothetical protein